MNTIKVKSLPLKGVIRDLSEEFDTTYSEHCEEYVLQLPQHVGNGEIRGINFEGGLGILLYDCTFHEDIEIQFVVNEVHPLKFIYCIEGQLSHRFENEDKPHHIIQYQEAIVASEKHNGHILRFKKSIKTKVNSLEIMRSMFQEKLACDLNSASKQLKSLFVDSDAEKTFYHEGFYSLQLSQIFREMEEFQEEYFIRKLFLEGKAYQMLTKQILLYQDDLKDVNSTALLRQSEIRQINTVVEIIERELADLDTVANLARRAGLNTNKLQDGFKYLFNLSVNEYIQETRLKRIQELILNTEHSISAIGGMVGLSSKSYLSKIFKNRFGTTPQEFRKNYQKSLHERQRS